MKSTFRTLLLVCTLCFSVSVFAQAPTKVKAEKAAKAESGKKKNKKKHSTAAVAPVETAVAPAQPAVAPVTPAPTPPGTNDATMTTDPNTGEPVPAELTTIKFDQDTYDFGKIKQGDVVKHKFTFTNTGDKNLVLENVQPSCGCTAIDWPREAIAPGKTASFEAQFNSTGKSGPQMKYITIIYNGAERMTRVTFTGDVVVPDGATPTPGH
jgi:hypothetical protein